MHAYLAQQTNTPSITYTGPKTLVLRLATNIQHVCLCQVSKYNPWNVTALWHCPHESCPTDRTSETEN